jgi:hypothetical protein
MQTEETLLDTVPPQHAENHCPACAHDIAVAAANAQLAAENAQKVLNGAQKIYEKFANNPMLSRFLGGSE